MKIKRIVSIVIASVLISINCISVYAAEDMTRSDWGYFWLQNYCGVDTSQIKNTDYGSSFADIAQRYGTTTIDNSITAVQNQINNPSYDAFYEYVKTQTHNTYVTTNNLSHYITQQGQRTVETTGKKLWDMSGSSFFNSLYNKFFNNNGYKEQYETIPGQGGSYNDTVNNVSISITPVGYVWAEYNGGPIAGMSTYPSSEYQNIRDLFVSGYVNLLEGSQWRDASGCTFHQDSSNYCAYIYNVNIDNYVLWYKQYFGRWDSKMSNPQATFFNSSGKIGCTVTLDGSYANTFVFNFPWSDSATIGDGSTTVGLPSQIGGYFDENGVWHPLYTDPSLNPEGLVINPNGTVTRPDGQTVSIYIDPPEVSPEGQNEILKYWSDTPPDIDPSGYPWNDLTLSPDGNGGFNLSGLGEALKGLFDALLEGLKAVIGGIGDIIKEVFEGISEALENLIELLGSIFSLEWANDLDLSLIELPDFANIFDDLINSFGSQLGLGDLT